jgi:hypothetical protein
MSNLHCVFSRFKLDPQQQQFVTGHQFGVPIAASAAHQAVWHGYRLGAAAAAANAEFCLLDIKLGSFGRRSGAGDRVGVFEQLRVDAGERPDAKKYLSYA